MLTRRRLIALCAAPALAPNLFIRVACAQTPKGDFPNKPVRLIVPVAAGGPTDIVARMLAEKLSKMWGQQVVVENKGGAGTHSWLVTNPRKSFDQANDKRALYYRAARHVLERHNLGARPNPIIGLGATSARW